MTKLLLSIHVLAAILAVGPVAVAASLFPRQFRVASGSAGPGSPAPGSPGPGSLAPGSAGPGVAVALHRICRVYAVIGLTVPAFGLATGASLGVLTDAWLLVSIALTALAAAMLALLILPGQRRLLASPAAAGVSRLAMSTGIFNLLWATVVVLMIVRPGSTTGA